MQGKSIAAGQRFWKPRAFPAARTGMCVFRHCERSEAIHLATRRKNGSLRRFAPRNDGWAVWKL